MTTATVSPRSHLTFGGVLRSEWIKLRTLRSTIWCFAIIVAISVGLSALLATTLTSGGMPLPAMAEQELAVQVVTISLGFSTLVSSVLGALVITGEYGTGMIRSTLAAVPRRTPALLAKLIVFGVATFLVGIVSLALSTAVAALLMPLADVTPDFLAPDFLLPMLGGAGYLALLGMLALTLGAIIRNSAGGIAAALALVLVVPTVLNIFAAVTQAQWVANLDAFLPASAGARMFAFIGGQEFTAVEGSLVLEPWQGTLVLVGWVVALGLVATALLKRRDA